MTRAALALFLLAILSLACASSTAISAPVAHPAVMSPAAPAPTPPALSGTITAARSVNIRDQPTEHGASLGYKYNGNPVTVLGCVGGWARIGNGQFVNGRYINNGICK